MKLAVYSRLSDENDTLFIREVLAALHDMGCKLFLHEHCKNAAIAEVSGYFGSHEELGRLQPVDFVLSFGGDGTYIDAANLVGNLNIPLLGVNTGRVGFLTAVNRNNYQSCFEKLKLKFPTTDTIMNILHLDNVKKNCYQFFPINSKSKDYHYGLVIFSRYRILKADYVFMNDTSTNAAIYADIKYKGDTLRVYNVHLASLRMDADDYALGREIVSHGIDDPNLDKKAKILSKKVGKAFLERQGQAQILRAHIDSCNYPIIICGDFNDSPVSYSYHKISHGLKDAFRVSGGGRGHTYCGDAFPSYRIDYIFHDERYKSFGFTTYDSLTVSDHYPIWTNISLLK